MEQSARRGNAKMRRAMRRYVMKISECMSRNVQLATPDHSLQSAAQMMADIDTGFLPVADNDRLIGIVTDRDIAIRGVAAGRRPEASIREVMSDEVKYCFDDQDVRSEEHTSELQSLMRNSYAVLCLTKKKQHNIIQQ